MQYYAQKPQKLNCVWAFRIEIEISISIKIEYWEVLHELRGYISATN